jgi:hypothetical protein
MNRGLIAGVALAVVASAVTAGIVVVVGQEGGNEPHLGPYKALSPREIGELPPPPGTPVAAGLSEPVDYGPFRILPSDAALPPPCGAAVPPGLTQDRVEVVKSPTQQELADAGWKEKEPVPLGLADPDQFRDHDLFFEPPYMPEGWELAEVHAETVIWSDGSTTGSAFHLYYIREDYFGILIGRIRSKPACKVERVEELPQGQHAYTLGEIRGLPVLYLHQTPGEKIQADLWVEFVIDGVLTRVSSVAIDFDELIMIADALIAEAQEATSTPP